MEPKEQILQSAIELFSNKGLDGVSIREIAEHANVHFSSIRYYFGDKDELYKTCISRHGESRLKIAKKYLDCAPLGLDDARFRLSFALRETFDTHCENPFLSKLLLREIETSSGQSDVILRKTMVAMSEIHVQFFTQCQQRKLLINNIAPDFATQALMGMIHHFMRTESIRSRILSHPSLKNKDHQDKIITQIIDLLFNKEEIPL